MNTVGEVLTSDEVIERLEQADAERAAKKKTKKKGRTTEKATAQQESESSDPDKVYCGSCGQLYTDAESNYWIRAILGGITGALDLVLCLVKKKNGFVSSVNNLYMDADTKILQIIMTSIIISLFIIPL